MSNCLDDIWEDTTNIFDRIKSETDKTKTLHINKRGLKSKIVSFGQKYFRNARPQIEAIKVETALVHSLDTNVQSLLRLAQTRSKREDYRLLINNISRDIRSITIDIELKLGSMPIGGANINHLTDIEQGILDTLYKLVPSAALSYEQAIKNISDGNIKSHRGTAHELREALRDVLDHLAPDELVMKEKGFVLEKDQKRPGMKQKARFILKARGLAVNAIRVPETGISLIEEYQASLARVLYDRSSISAHVNTTREEVRTIKKYIDTVLGELLQV